HANQRTAQRTGHDHADRPRPSPSANGHTLRSLPHASASAASTGGPPPAPKRPLLPRRRPPAASAADPRPLGAHPRPTWQHPPRWRRPRAAPAAPLGFSTKRPHYSEGTRTGGIRSKTTAP